MACFEFVTSRSSGVARFGEVEFGVSSIVNNMVLRIDPSRVTDLDVSVKDLIVAWVLPDDSERYEAFRGVVTSVNLSKGFLVIEAATPTAFLAAATSEVKSWSNCSIKSILLDLLAMSKADFVLAQLPASLSDTILHSWNTHSGSLAEEIDTLLRSARTGLDVYGGPDGRLYVGDRASLSTFFSPFCWPTDDAVSDLECVVFQLRPGFVYQPVFDPLSGDFVGTIDNIAHTISEAGARTYISIDEHRDASIEERVKSLASAVSVKEE